MYFLSDPTVYQSSQLVAPPRNRHVYKLEPGNLQQENDGQEASIQHIQYAWCDATTPTSTQDGSRSKKGRRRHRDGWQLSA